MHITTDTKTLKGVLDVVSRVSMKHITLPVLQCVKIDVQKNSILLSATNLEIGIEGTIAGEITEEGVVSVPAHILLQTVQLIPDASVQLLTEGDVLIVESKASRTEIKSMPSGDFPSIPKVSSDPILMNASLFALGIKTTAGMASVSSIKPELGSIYIFQKKEHSLTFVATDSFRLMEKTVPQKNLVFSEPILIPFKNALELARVAENSEGDIALMVNENQCAITVGNVYITSRLVKGVFPDYEQIIPKEYKTNCTLLTADFTQGLKKTSIFLNKFMQVTITISENTFTLSAQSGDAGATTESLRATVEGDDLVLNFNQRYISDVLQHIQSDSIHLKCAGVGRPMVIQNLHDDSLRYLVMPMNK